MKTTKTHNYKTHNKIIFKTKSINKKNGLPYIIKVRHLFLVLSSLLQNFVYLFV